MHRFGSNGAVIVPQLRQVLGSLRWPARRSSWSFFVVASRLRFVIPMGKDCGSVTVLSESSSQRRTGCRGAASASQGHFIGFGYNSCLTIRSSRTRFVTQLKCVVVPLPQLTDSQVAGRLNSGVRPHKASAKVWRQFRCFGSVASVGFGFVALARSSHFGEFPCSCVRPALRGSCSNIAAS